MSILEPTRELVFDKVDAIASKIASSEAASMYWQARDKMMHHQEAQGLFDELKKKTNGLLVLKDRLGEQSDKYQRIKQETARIEERLAEIPVALQYKAAQDELNAMLQEVILVLLARLKDEVPVEPGPRQCGSGGSCSTGGSCSCSH
ncbi:YlbF family regulator [Alicyclobacillus acidoterrestris]|uniref:YlbF family regulator n=1 Tax=Alicyclobacillus acidoterrestris (strain ATCC 49025 / DSM 3922 / CIP 106132 / NCIMB 13137 / GD3B) TaxID=1356854 RepID=T0CKM6_ALIAG|nr:YlbF family regulator [Alicyclobacillus acidoterrestris]EPZ53055.1 hypothetical protein N007_18495 [Alicyclobacillus acidoterrestris ATCC 49025]UNO47185.1 YlbF family regulator [Alicyclobacillus acidoterrestris]